MKTKGVAKPKLSPLDGLQESAADLFRLGCVSKVAEFPIMEVRISHDERRAGRIETRIGSGKE